MQVVINAAHLPVLYAEEYSSLLSVSFGMIASNHPEHHFIFVCPLQFKQKQAPAANIKFHIVKACNLSVLKNRYWFDISIPRILKRYNADLFVSPVYCSLTAAVPQCLLMHLPDIVNYPSLYSGLHAFFYKKYTPLFIKKATHIVSLSGCAEKVITARYPAAINKTTVWKPVVPEVYRPVSYTIAERVKNKYTDGKEYFLYGGSIHPSANLHSLLKAFSLFKKRQQSSTKLVIASFAASANAAFVKSLATYKYRNDVVFIENCSEEEYVELLASAYTFVYPVVFNGLYLRILQAVQSHVPVIASDSALAREFADKAALYVDPSSQQDIADKLMRIYKDEGLRNELITSAVAIASSNSNGAGEQLWENILKTVASLS